MESVIRNTTPNFSLFGLVRHQSATEEDNDPTNYQCIEVNSTFEEWFELDKCDIIGKSLSQIQPLPALPGFEWMSFFQTIRQNNGMGSLEIYSHPLEKLFTIQAYYESDQFTTIFIDSTSQLVDRNKIDIKEKHLIEQKLLESEKRFRDIIDSLPVISVQGYDKNRNVIYWNKASETLYGYTSEEALDKKLEDLIIPHYMKDGVVQGIQDWLDKGIKIPSSELILKRKDNSPVPIYSSHLMLKNIHGEDELFCIDCDLSELKKVEHDLKESELYHRSLLKTIPDIVFVISVNGDFIDIHKTIEFDHFLYGKEFINKNIRDVLPIHVAEKQLYALKKCIEEQTIENFEFYIDTPDGINYYSARTVSFGFDKGLVTVRNITESQNNLDSIKSLLLTEEKLNESLRDFTYIVSHNLRIHTANMLGVFMLLEETNPDLYTNSYIQILNSAAKNLEMTVNDLNNVLSIKFKEKLSKENINLSDLIDEIVSELKNDALDQGVTIVTHIPSNINVHVVAIYLKSILFHLILNGIKYKSSDQEPWVRIYLEESEDYWKICVEDNGIGIDMDHNKDKLSQMYKRFNNSRESKGFGLFISKIQVEAMGGFIQVESKLNQGSILSVFIPHEKD